MKKNKKILVVSLASLLIVGLVGTTTGLIIKKNKSSDSSTNQKDTLTSFYVDKSNINFTDDLLKFDVKAVALPSSLNLKIIWECENTTNIKLTYSESDSTKCTVECIAKFSDPLSMVCYPDGFKDKFSKTINLSYNGTTPTDKTYTTKIYISTAGDYTAGYSVAYTNKYTISDSSISSILALVQEDYVNTLSSYTYSSSRSNISSMSLTCELYYYKTSTPIETTYTMSLKVYIDGTLNDDTSVQFAKGYTVDLSQYKNITTTASGDWDESQYSFSSMTLDGVTKTGTETFSMDGDHALVVNFVKNTPPSTDKTYTTKIYTSTTGDVDEGYAVAYTDSYTISDSSISSILALVDEDYINTLSSYTYSSTRSNISSTDLTCNLYYYKTSTPIETTYTMSLKVYIDDTLNDDTSVQIVKGHTVDLSQYKNITTTASGDWDESQYSFSSMTLDGVAKTGTETFSMEGDHALVVKFVKNTPPSTDKTYTTKIYTSTTGDVDGGYSVVYTDSYTISDSSISSILALVDEDYANALKSFTYSSSRSTISSTDLTCNLYYYKTSTPIETTYTMALKVYIDDTLNDDTSVQIVKGHTVDLSQYKNITTTASGDWDESQYSFSSMTLDGVAKTGTETFSMEGDHALVVKFVKNTPPESYTLTIYYYFDGLEDVGSRKTKSIARGTEVFPSDYKLSVPGYSFQNSVPNDSFDMNDNNSIQFNYKEK